MDKPLPKLEEMKDILDLKGIHLWDLTGLWIGLAVLLFFLLGLLTYYFVTKYRAKHKPLGPPPTPIEKALARLNELVKRGLVEAGKIRLFYFHLSEIFRDFLEEEVQVMAHEATLEELRPLVKNIQDFNQEEIREAIWFLELSDMAKFARYVPPKEDMVKSVKICRVLMSTLARRRQVQEKESQSVAAEELAGQE